MKTNRPLLLLPLILLFVSPGLAGQNGFDDIFSDSSGQTEVPENQIRQSSFSPVLSGETGMELKGFMDDGADSLFEGNALGRLLLTAKTGSLEGRIRMVLESPGDEIPLTPLSVLEEVSLSWFFDGGFLEAGLMKTEWGKGDGIHVVDPLNPLTQTRGISLDLNKMKRPELMARVNWFTGKTGLWELVFLPFFHPAESAEEGRWALADLSALPNLTRETTDNFKFLHGGLRYTFTIGPADLGFLYYYGYKTNPGYRFETVLTGDDPYNPADYTTSTNEVFTPAHLFGLEGAAAAGPFTFRWEAGYWRTRDTRGDEPEYYNGSLTGLAGADLFVPGTDIFLSLQVTETWILDYRDLAENDVDRLTAWNDQPRATTFVGAAELPFLRNRFKIRLAGIWQLETGGYMAAPQIFWKIEDDLLLTLEGQFFGSFLDRESYFRTWDDNDSLSLSLVYTF